MEYTITAMQYHNMWASGCATRNGITRDEVDDCYPFGSKLSEWSDAIAQHVKKGGTVAPAILDDMCTRFGTIALRPFRGVMAHGIPSGYVAPQSVVQRERELEQEMTATARERWAAMAGG